MEKWTFPSKLDTNPSAGWELIEPTLQELESKMREAQLDAHDGKRKCETLWPIFKIAHEKRRYMFDLYYRRDEISKKLYEFYLYQGYADKNLIAKPKKVLTMELRKRRRSLQDEVAYVSDSSFTSDDDNNPFNAWDEDGDNSTNSPSVSLEAEASDNSKDENTRNILQRTGMSHGFTYPIGFVGSICLL
ncbi:hypothetical protein Cgig2_024082 [Carnegiea gigantea]|uniref:Uncharacterized protein n=1 Tax=Carnegiea gigantea TaxID=171969 RepID=A0A9Q1K7H4_9CARY|nr:hypothetical protein Cgig2_024082 [Carnegiea gigantea]